MTADAFSANNSMPRQGNNLAETVLVVDDDDTLRQVICSSLEAAGIPTDSCADGPAALTALAANTYAALIIDNAMPTMSGIDIIRALRRDEKTATLPIILVTAATDRAERIEGIQSGASDYVAKPLDIDELLARLKSQLMRQAAWMSKVEGHLRERAAIARTLSQIAPAGTPEATADIVCRELASVHQLRGVAMFSFGQGDVVVPLARHGEPILGEETGEPLDRIAGRYLLAKSESGPWTERSENLRFVLNTRANLGGCALAFAPMVADRNLLGLLVLLTDRLDSAPVDVVTSALSAAIDFGGVAAGLLAPTLAERGRDHARHLILDHILQDRAFYPVFQPIVDLTHGHVRGFETLTRFNDGVRPDVRFDEATILGRGPELELATLEVAIQASANINPQAFMSANVSPALVMERNVELARLINSTEREIVLELTEHERVDDYAELRRALDALGPGTKISVDDAGSGFASLRHVLSLEPSFVKLDLSLVHDIHTDPARQALVAGLEYFATETQACLIAEGIECDDEMETLQRLDVELGQGYLLGRPAPADQTDLTSPVGL